MIKITSINTGLFPFGPGRGNRAVMIRFENDTSPDPAPDTKPSDEDYAKTLLEGVESFMQGSSNEENAKLWEDALIARAHIVFSGESMAHRDNIPVMNHFFAHLSRKSLDRQKNSVAVHKLRPPFMIFHGKPIHFTQPNDFYENFQVCVLECGVDAGLTPETQLSYFRNVAMVETAGHAFSTFIFRISEKEDLDRFKTFYRDEEGVLDVSPERVYFVPAHPTEASVAATLEGSIKFKTRFDLNMSHYVKSGTGMLEV